MERTYSVDLFLIGLYSFFLKKMFHFHLLYFYLILLIQAFQCAHEITTPLQDRKKLYLE